MAKEPDRPIRDLLRDRGYWYDVARFMWVRAPADPVFTEEIVSSAPSTVRLMLKAASSNLPRDRFVCSPVTGLTTISEICGQTQETPDTPANEELKPDHFAVCNDDGVLYQVRHEKLAAMLRWLEAEYDRATASTTRADADDGWQKYSGFVQLEIEADGVQAQHTGPSASEMVRGCETTGPAVAEDSPLIRALDLVRAPSRYGMRDE